MSRKTRPTFRESVQQFTRRRSVRWLYRFYYWRLTPAGRAMVWLWAGAGLLGQTTVYPVYRLWAFASVALALAALLARRRLPPLRLRRRPLPGTSAGETVGYEVEVENLSTRSVRNLGLLELDLPEALRLDESRGHPVLTCLGPGERARLPLRLRCLKRGSYTLTGLVAASSWPLGLVRAFRPAEQETSFLVYPAFTTPESFPVPEGMNYQPGGILLSSSVGESAEFMHTREFRDGDNPRHVHWASTARLGKPIVKVYHDEYFVRLALALDTEVPPGTSDAAFEAGISTAAGIADNLSRRDYIIDIFAAGARVYHFQAGRALAHLDHILQILACLDASPGVDWDALCAAVVPEAPRLTGVVAILMDWTEERERFVSELRSRGVGVRVLVVRDGPTTSPPPALPPDEFLHLPPGQAIPSLDTPLEVGSLSA